MIDPGQLITQSATRKWLTSAAVNCQVQQGLAGMLLLGAEAYCKELLAVLPSLSVSVYILT